ncbi:hypothetical protein DAEQUDRAFT_728953 [Daedalea quercina L-15889]|uniref:Uncharacterized protein n=1 Tax=Daedalea quercina L-15889 TaxID=1314783 RepID=A0A165NY15_9APHY|nr:hypothetical protein DAEQUDRAFT_728953 [Daedalea quercina L-15889]
MPRVTICHRVAPVLQRCLHGPMLPSGSPGTYAVCRPVWIEGVETASQGRVASLAVCHVGAVGSATGWRSAFGVGDDLCEQCVTTFPRRATVAERGVRTSYVAHCTPHATARTAGRVVEERWEYKNAASSSEGTVVRLCAERPSLTPRHAAPALLSSAHCTAGASCAQTYLRPVRVP